MHGRCGIWHGRRNSSTNRARSVEKLRGLMPGSLGDWRERPRQRIRMKGRGDNADVRGKIP